jgi:hypothetical protein
MILVHAWRLLQRGDADIRDKIQRYYATCELHTWDSAASIATPTGAVARTKLRGMQHETRGTDLVWLTSGDAESKFWVHCTECNTSNECLHDTLTLQVDITRLHNRST